MSAHVMRVLSLRGGRGARLPSHIIQGGSRSPVRAVLGVVSTTGGRKARLGSLARGATSELPAVVT